MDSKPEALYYIQNRGYSGNCLRWWKEGYNGYTSNLNEAARVTLDEAKRLTQRPDDSAWPVAVVDSMSERHVNGNKLRLLADTWRVKLDDARMRRAMPVKSESGMQ